MRLAGTRLRHHPKYAGLTEASKAGPVWNGQVRGSVKAEELEAPLHWRDPRQIFVCSMGDLFYERVGRAAIDHVFAMAVYCELHLFQILTKRAKRMADELEALGQDLERVNRWIQDYRNDPDTTLDHVTTWPPPNVWLGFSAEDQERFDERWPHMRRLAEAGWNVFVSLEPLLGPIEFGEALATLGARDGSERIDRPGISYVIVGGESGPGARPSTHPDDVRAIRRQCQEKGVGFHLKQWGEFWYGRFQYHPTVELIDAPCGDHPGKFDLMRCHDIKGGWLAERVGVKGAGRTLDGRTHDDQMTDSLVWVLRNNPLVKPNISFSDWLGKLHEVNREGAYYDEIDPNDWRGYYDDWYTPGEAMSEDQSYD
jgi:protein gp37